MKREGEIQDFAGSWGSGFATIRFTDGMTVTCENAPTVRCLDAMFGGVISPGHRVNVAALKGKQVVYGVDELGILEWIAPADAEVLEQ